MNSPLTHLISTIGINNSEIVNQLASEEYQHFDISDFSPHKSKVAWKCYQGHITYTTLYKKINGSGCLVCTGKQILTGYNDLASQYPFLAEEWHPAKNEGLLPTEVSSGSNRKVWWYGSCQHEWPASISSRSKEKRGCPYCSNQKVLSGYNDLASQYPEIAAKWHPIENGHLSPVDIISKSNKKYAWLCENNHTFINSPANLIKGIQCGVCKNKQTAIGINSLRDTHPLLEKEYSEKNTKKFTEYRKNSKEKVLWKCDNNHEWESSIYKRAILGRGCHQCSGFVISKGINDFLSQADPVIIKSFDKNKNNIKIEDLFISSRAMVWWKCENNHEWPARVYSRTLGSGCPKCANQISKAEEQISNYLEEKITIVKNNRDIISPYELDIYIPERKIAIEFNGLYWHSEEQGKGRNYHYNKWNLCKEQGIQLIQIWEDDWNRNPELILQMLSHKIGLSSQQNVYARKTIIGELSKETTDEFFNNNHIQGSVDGKIRIGLYEEKMLVAAMILKAESGTKGKTLSLLRYATSKNVIGGFTKLLSWVEKNIPDINCIVTFSDNTISDGGLYANNGFQKISDIKPDYMYIINGERKHKFNYRIGRFYKDPSLIWEQGLSESQLAIKNNISRIWDAGKIKWQKKI